METGNQTLPVIQRPQRINTALKIDVEVEVRGLCSMLLQQRQRDVMTGADGEQMMPVVPGLCEHPIEIGAQGFDMRLHPRPGATFGPDELFRKFGQPRLSTLRPGHQGFAQHGLPFADRVPHVAIGAPEPLRGVTDRAAFDQSREQIKQSIAHCGTALLAQLESVSQVNPGLALGRARMPCTCR